MLNHAMSFSIASCLLAICCTLQLACSMPTEDDHVGPLTSKLHETYIVGGVPAQPNKWRWQVFIQIAYNAGAKRCGGSIINERWVVTAAHCVKSRSKYDLTVYAGAHTFGSTDPSVEKFGVTNLVKHPSYNVKTFRYDIALLKLDREIPFTIEIGPVCLPKKDVPVSTSCITYGWGPVETGGPCSNILRQIDVEIKDASACPNTQGGAVFYDTINICAGKPNKDTCHGDSGSGLLFCEDGTYYLQGVTSWGDPKCGVGSDAFVRVRALNSWITSTAGANSKPCGVSHGSQILGHQLSFAMSLGVLLYYMLN